MAVIDAGASLVVGSGPHVIRGVEDYQGHMVAYSLGNFVGYHTLGGGGIVSESAILSVTLGAGGKVLAAAWIPIELDERPAAAGALGRQRSPGRDALGPGLPARPLPDPRQRSVQATR